MNKKILILPAVIAGLGLASCSNKAEADQAIKIAGSKGTAAVALAGKISEGTTKITSSYAKAAFELNKTTDVVVTDAATGMHKLVQDKNSAYGITRAVSKNSDLLISVNGGSSVTDESVVLSYGKGSSSDLAFNKLCQDFWDVKPTIKYVELAKDLLKAYETGKIGEDTFDFTICPLATCYELDVNEEKYAIAGSYGILNDLNTYWSQYTDALPDIEKQDFIPGLVTFVSESATKSKAKVLDSFYKELDVGIKNAVETPENLATVMDGYSLDTTQQMEMFETTSTIIKQAIADDSANVCKFVAKDETVDVKTVLGNFMEVVDFEVTDYSGCFFAE